ncbi:MAG: hypothetical protein M1832_003195 [Thelocarpon impressellum]|nr:MAG: hypothetical protein M1832_003195 [Thelocarpon impressellum]
MGRGGAGNVLRSGDLAAAAEARGRDDLEAQNPTHPVGDAPPPSASTPAYTGRGGAGNAIPSPAEGASEQAVAAQKEESKTVQTKVRYKISYGPQTAVGGRGGAGNIYEARLIEERRRKELEAKEAETRERVKEEAKKDVEGLAVPGRAFLGGRAREQV